MGFWDVFSVLNKFVPGREERIRNKIKGLEDERQIILAGPCTVRATARVERINIELSKLKKTLENR
jgi:3-deoxy-D-arabino-heptulosonate 7-phosphate (DAHP) synthase